MSNNNINNVNNINNINNDKSLNIRTPDKIVENVQKWVILDTKLKEINEKSKNIRDMKTNIGEEITNYMKENDLNNHIEISDGELRIHEKKEYSCLSFGFIENCLKNIIKDETQIEYIIQYLKNERKITHSTEIKRVYTKDKNYPK